ncbi:MAG: hypothetical protein WGN25_03475 [Candidatus Electrothrix sp. GW3-4]|uniref:hypothetical protein n=1 Tax=Candidatus Electrothrix sp. GW3-4 TaxID=3126740 RepID=UPI0030D2E280
MNQKILLFTGLLLTIPFIASAQGAYIDHAYSVQCEALDETNCIVKSNRNIKSVRVEFSSQEENSSSDFMKKELQGCPPEVSVNFNSPPEAKFFIEACDGSNGIKIISL